MAIKNFTTQISVEKTLGEIQRMLARQGAEAILTEYEGGVVSFVSFRIQTPQGKVSFRLPANIVGVLRRLEADAPKRLQTKEQASRVAWRIVKDWVAAQLALVEAELAAVAEVFLPYAQDSKGQTLYERFVESPKNLLT